MITPKLWYYLQVYNTLFKPRKIRITCNCKIGDHKLKQYRLILIHPGHGRNVIIYLFRINVFLSNSSSHYNVQHCGVRKTPNTMVLFADDSKLIKSLEHHRTMPNLPQINSTITKLDLTTQTQLT